MATTSGVGSSTSVPDWMTNSNAKPASAQDTTDGLANRNTFLQLLVAQLRNQNPLNPQDGVQFISQLAQFSDLEQTMQMRQELTSIRTTLDQYVSGQGTDSGTDSSSGA